MLVSVNFKFIINIVRLFLLIFGSLFSILILEMYSRYFDPVTRILYPSVSSILEPINIIQYCSLSLRRAAHEDKRMCLELIHGLFIT